MFSFGMFYEGELVCAISMRRSTEKTIEIARFANKINTSVVGGFSRLMKMVISKSKSHKFNQILTYADRAISDGRSYEKYGFKKDGITVPSLYYTDEVLRFSRQKVWKGSNEKLKPIYGPGNIRFIMDI